ncbi:MAG: RecQ family ATP-dependent DNA helicase, partial [Holophagales bacterium]|nr:RecQ family ATP-dependent DNA helicase [Holophagales bacterium]
MSGDTPDNPRADPRLERLLERALCLDLELSPGEGPAHGRLRRIGAIRFESGEERPLSLEVGRRRNAEADALAELEGFAAGARWVVGHNLLWHDLPALARYPGLCPTPLRLPVVDTLPLSVLAFPRHPYHHLVKDYRLVRDAVNDPVADARLCLALLRDIWQQLGAEHARAPRLLPLFARCLGGLHEHEASGVADSGGGTSAEHVTDQGGHRTLLEHLAGRPALSRAELVPALGYLVGDRVCRWALDQLGDELDARAGTAVPVEMAFAVAWLRVAGDASVLPAWVRLRFPRLDRLLDRLRQPAFAVDDASDSDSSDSDASDRVAEVRGDAEARTGAPCGERADCRYCQGPGAGERREGSKSAAGLGPRAELRRVFGFDDFRPEPRDDRGRSLQRSVVERGLARRPHLAVLATGAGKSICYQLPALVHYRRRGLLTVVISPLQALMKDQVDQLERLTGSGAVAALYGLLTPPARGSVLERVRMGEIGLLYVAPEQLRNRTFEATVKKREIAAWVYDEAHCLSKWGHDFRPDYLYAARFVRQLAEAQHTEPPSVACFTATAKRDVIEEIRAHFATELDQELEVLAGTMEREELRFRVEPTAAPLKLDRIRELVAERHGGDPSVPRAVEADEAARAEAGSMVVYFSSRRGAESAAQWLQQAGFPARCFHAGLDAAEKRDVLEAFSSGEAPVICATNAFGMGIDKNDVRLVVHADIPGSLEAYLQEAGRAGRDRRPSDCVLLFDEQDVERQFRLAAGSRLGRREMAEMLRAVRRAVRASRGGVAALTAGEMLRDDALDLDLRPGDWGADTKVLTAIAWLERAGFLRRGHNRTRVVQGQLKLKNMEEARRRVAALGLGPAEADRWLAVIEALIRADADAGADRGLSVDQLAELPGMAPGEGAPSSAEARDSSDRNPPAGRAQEASHAVLRTLERLVRAGFLTEGLRLSARLVARGAHNARGKLERLAEVEVSMLEELKESEPDADDGEWKVLSLRRLNQRLLDRGLASNPVLLRGLLRGLARDGRGLAGSHGSLDLAIRDRDRLGLRLRRSWGVVEALAELRRRVAGAVLADLVARVDPRIQGHAQVEFGLEDLAEALRRDLRLRAELRDPLAAAERGLLFLHEQKVLLLQNGLAIFRQAMTLELEESARGRRFSGKHYAPLEEHYGERTFQIHVMARYAQLALEKVQQGLRLVGDYFSLERTGFVERWFHDQRDLLARATGGESYRRIVDSLGNAEQQAIVTAGIDRNLLVLAGPGSGKTRVVVHRAAYLLRVMRVPARSILVVCFNRNASLELRRRLGDLV